MGRKSKGRIANFLPRECLIKTIKNTYEDSNFVVQTCMDPEYNFTRRHYDFTTDSMTRLEVLALLKESTESIYYYQDKRHRKILLTPELVICTGSILENQVYNTYPEKNYHHIFWEAHPHYEVYFYIDHEQQTINFVLGTFKRTLKICEHYVHTWRLHENAILCNTMEVLEQKLLTSGRRRFGVDLGRHALGIKDTI